MAEGSEVPMQTLDAARTNVNSSAKSVKFSFTEGTAETSSPSMPGSDSDAEVSQSEETMRQRPAMHSRQDPLQRSSVQSRMMRNIGGGTSSIRECIFVIIAGQLLAFNSGYINGACLSGFLVENGQRQSVAGFTGAYTISALQLMDGDVSAFAFQGCMILSFLLGAFLSGLLTPKPTAYRIEPTYGPTLLLGGLVLLTASVLEATPHSSSSSNVDKYVFYLAALANGIQNGVSSIYSANLIRSTHLTGTTTDIGIFAGQLVRGNDKNNWKLIVLVALAASFWCGAALSFFATQRFTSYSLLFNAGLFLSVGLGLVVFLVLEHSITIQQALFGTWQWKRAMEHLSNHYEMNTRASSRFMEPKDRLLKLYSKLKDEETGTVLPEDLLDILCLMDSKIKMKDAQAMVKAADRDGNGEISEEDWRHFVESLSK